MSCHHVIWEQTRTVWYDLGPWAPGPGVDIIPGTRETHQKWTVSWPLPLLQWLARPRQWLTSWPNPWVAPAVRRCVGLPHGPLCDHMFCLHVDQQTLPTYTWVILGVSKSRIAEIPLVTSKPALSMLFRRKLVPLFLGRPRAEGFNHFGSCSIPQESEITHHPSSLP